MRVRMFVTFFVVGVFVVAAAAGIRPGLSVAATDDAAVIASAMSAAPPTIGQGATIVTMAKDGSMQVVRKGTNGFTCMPDNPETPGPDPMCLDSNAMEWLHAIMTHAAPPDKVGFTYMMAGGSDASNTDPYATKPAPGNHWISTGPHVMVVGPATKLMTGYSTSPDPDTTKPYVMWAGTPYAHLMIPINMQQIPSR